MYKGKLMCKEGDNKKIVHFNTFSSLFSLSTFLEDKLASNSARKLILLQLHP